jgi:hypothetical protein
LRKYSRRKSEIYRYSCSRRWWDRSTRRCSPRRILRKIQRKLFLRMMWQKNSYSCMMGVLLEVDVDGDIVIPPAIESVPEPDAVEEEGPAQDAASNDPDDSGDDSSSSKDTSSEEEDENEDEDEEEEDVDVEVLEDDNSAVANDGDNNNNQDGGNDNNNENGDEQGDEQGDEHRYRRAE